MYTTQLIVNGETQNIEKLPIEQINQLKKLFDSFKEES